MEHDHEWIPVGDNGRFLTWDEKLIGMPKDGTWKGQRAGQFGPVGDLGTPDGLVSFALPVVLERKLALVRIGATVRIVYLGEVTPKQGKGKGKPYKDFDVFVIGADNILPETKSEPGPRELGPGADTEVVF
jgi:hypothetical protein